MSTTRLLIVDDAFTILSLMDNLFKKKFEVIKCRSVREAKEEINVRTPDIIVTDLNMPDESGEDFISFLKSSERLESIPVVVLSGTDNTNTKLKMLKLGVDDYVQKPFNPEELGLRIDNILKRCLRPVYVS